MPKIHATAIVDPKAHLAPDVEIGPYCVIEGDVVIGPGCRLAEHVIIRRYTSMGANNVIDAFTVLGGLPQDFKFHPETVSYVKIGDNNTFREGCTISRATTPGNATVVGNKTYWMQGAHAGHDSTVEDEVVMVNGVAIAGHSHIGRKTILSAHVGVHQFTWIGEGAIVQGNGVVTCHLPPFCLGAGVNYVIGLNAVGLRRNPEITDLDRRQIKDVFRLLYRSNLSTSAALKEMDAHTNWGGPASRFREFVRKAITAVKPWNRGLASLRSTRQGTNE